MLWLRYWKNTKDVRVETQVPGSTLGVRQQVAQNNFGQQQVFNSPQMLGQAQVYSQSQVLGQVGGQQVSGQLTQATQNNRSAQQTLIALIKNDKNLGSLSGNVDVVNLIGQAFEALFGRIDSAGKEGVGLGIGVDSEDQRSHISVLASLFFDMADVYLGLCKRPSIPVSVFKDIHELTGVKTAKLNLSGREALLASQALCPNEGSYLDASKTDNNSQQRASILGIYSDPNTGALVEGFLSSINEARAFLMGGYLSKLTNPTDYDDNAVKVVGLLNSSVDSLNKIIQAEGVSNDKLGIRLFEDKGVLFKAETDMQNLLRAEHFLALVWALAQWTLTSMTSGADMKASGGLGFLSFSQHQKKVLELLVNFCSCKNFFILNSYTSAAWGILKIPQQTFFLDNLFAAIIKECLAVLQSAFVQSSDEDRIWGMDLFLNMLKTSSSAKGPWPERIPGAFKEVNAKLEKLMQDDLMDRIDAGEVFSIKLHRSNDPRVLSRFVDIVTVLKSKVWYRKVLTQKLLKNIDEKFAAVQGVLSKMKDRPVSTIQASSSVRQSSAAGTQALSPLPVGVSPFGY
jgi:hypothetical protein